MQGGGEDHGVGEAGGREGCGSGGMCPEGDRVDNGQGETGAGLL